MIQSDLERIFARPGINWEEIGKNIKEGRALRGCSQASLINQLNGAKGLLYKYESGKQPISAQNMLRIMKILNLPFEWFIGVNKVKRRIKKERLDYINALRKMIL